MLVNLNSNTSVNVTEDTRGPENSTSYNATTASTVLLAANDKRTNYSVYNPGPGTVYIKEGATATITPSKNPIPPGYMYKEDFPGGARYLGVISIIASVATTVSVSESATP